MIIREQRVTLLLHMIGRLIEKGSWFGETHIQKCIYFLQEFYNVPSGYEYILYKHGPFSFELRDELTAMRADELLSLVPRPPYGSSFQYGKTADLWMQKYQKEASNYFALTEKVVDVLAGKRVKELEQLTTALYVKKRSENKNVDIMADELISLKPHIEKEDALNAFMMLEDNIVFTA